MLKIRLARGGSKKRPYYRIVVADARMPRDGRYIEKVGTYNPMVAKDATNRVTLVEDRIKYWLGEGAQPTDRIVRFLEAAGIGEKRTYAEQPQKSKPSEKTLERIREKEEKANAAKEAAAAAEAEAAEAPAEEAPAEETATEAPAEEAKAEEAPAEEAKAEEAPAEEAKAEEAPAEEAKADEAPAEEASPEEAKAE